MLDSHPQTELVIGTRLRLLGHRIERRPLRYWLGRLFANVASLALGTRMFDTQCGAKLLRATPGVARVFERPFLTRWIFDVEILARLHHARRHTSLPQVREVVYEYPLDAWRNVAGSTVKGGDFVKAIGELAHHLVDVPASCRARSSSRDRALGRHARPRPPPRSAAHGVVFPPGPSPAPACRSPLPSAMLESA